MPTENEIRVMKILSAIDIPPAAAKKIEEWGNEAVTVVCEVALGTYPGLRMKVRTNAAALLGWMDHPQARETVTLLVNDPNPDVAIRGMRAAGRQKNEQAVEKLGQIVKKPESPPLLAAEALKALMTVDSARAKAFVDQYAAATPDAVPHRAASVIHDVFSRGAKR